MVTKTVQILHKRGIGASMPSLASSELGYATDTKKLYYGTGTENVEIAKKSDVPTVSTSTTSTSTTTASSSSAVKSAYDKANLANPYTTCSTAAGTAAKTATFSGFSLTAGAAIRVKFTYANTASTPTLNISSTGAKAIKQPDGTAFKDIKAGGVYSFTYDGTSFICASAGGGYSVGQTIDANNISPSGELIAGQFKEGESALYNNYLYGSYDGYTYALNSKTIYKIDENNGGTTLADKTVWSLSVSSIGSISDKKLDILTGNTYILDSPNKKAYKISNAGSIEWTYTISSAGTPTFIFPGEDGNIYITTETSSSSDARTAEVQVLSSSGVLLKTMSNSSWSTSYSQYQIVRVNPSGYIFASYKENSSTDPMKISKLNSSGVIQSSIYLNELNTGSSAIRAYQDMIGSIVYIKPIYYNYFYAISDDNKLKLMVEIPATYPYFDIDSNGDIIMSPTGYNDTGVKISKLSKITLKEVYSVSVPGKSSSVVYDRKYNYLYPASERFPRRHKDFMLYDTYKIKN